MRGWVVSTGLLVLVLGSSLTSCGQSPRIASPQAKVAHGTQATHPRRNVDRPKPSPTTPSPASPRRCRADQLRLAVALSGSTMSQPFADISITNSGTSACVLTGYPRIVLAGHLGFPDQPAPAGPVGITVRHRIYERVDPGPHEVLVSEHHQVFFSIGTADAYDGPLFTLTRLTVVLPGTKSPQVLPVDLLANGPPGRRIPVGLTAVNDSPHA